MILQEIQFRVELQRIYKAEMNGLKKKNLGHDMWKQSSKRY